MVGGLTLGILDIFSKRNNENQKSIFKHDEIPQPLRVQIIHIWRDAIGHYVTRGSYYTDRSSNATWEFIHKALCKEYGLLSLSSKGHNSISRKSTLYY